MKKKAKYTISTLTWRVDVPHIGQANTSKTRPMVNGAVMIIPIAEVPFYEFCQKQNTALLSHVSVLVCQSQAWQLNSSS